MPAPRSVSKRALPDSSRDRPYKKPRPARDALPSHSLIRPQAEPEFIRGGAETLTPLERRQIAAQAAQDVLFEEHAHNHPASISSGNEEAESLPDELPARGHHRRRAPISQPKSNGSLAPTRIVCEGLTMKKLVPGTKVLGQVCEIHDKQLVLSLPNNLTGYVSITAISPGLNKRLAVIAGTLDADEDMPPGEPDLALLFRLGQYLRAAVVSNHEEDDSGAGRKRRIELSIDPELTNRGCRQSEVTVNATLQTEVISIEDYGVLVSFGLGKSVPAGFVPLKNTPKQLKYALRPGMVVLGTVTDVGENVITLTYKVEHVEDGSYLKSAPGVGALLPGTAVELVVSGVTASGLVGKVLGLVDVMADVIHSGAWSSKVGLGLSETYVIGSKVKGRLLWTSDANGRSQVGVSLLPHMVNLGSVDPSNCAKLPNLDFAIGKIIEDAYVTAVEPKFGLFMDIGSQAAHAFVHISRAADETIEALSESSGPYKLRTSHPCRLLGFNFIDGLYQASLAPKTLALPYLRLEDLWEGQLVHGTIERLTMSFGAATGALVKLTDKLVGFVQALHLSDVDLDNPERKFRPGVAVTARVLAIDLEARTLRLTFKKTLVYSEAPVWSSYEDLEIGASAPGTIVSFLESRAGVLIHFYGSVRGMLPTSLMSENYIDDPQAHFRLGQVVNVRILKVDPAAKRLILTIRDPDAFTPEQQESMSRLELGSLVDGIVTEKTPNAVVLQIHRPKLKAILTYEHFIDGSLTAVNEAARRFRIGQKMRQLIVLRKDFNQGRLELSNKPSIVKARPGRFPSRFQDLVVGMNVDGYIKNITDFGVFVSFLGDLTGLLPRANLDKKIQSLPQFGFRKDQSMSLFVWALDRASARITLSSQDPSSAAPADNSRFISNPVDGVTKDLGDFVVGKMTRARVASVKESQLNMLLADNIRGRIEVSQAFNSWDDIKDKAHPLGQFQVGQEIPVRILGTHDAKTHRFLPISHFGKSCIYELSAKTSSADSLFSDMKTVHDVSVGSTYTCFANNITPMGLWVNLSPTVRGRIPRLEVSSDFAVIANMHVSFKIGSAIEARVTGIDVQSDSIVLTARPEGQPTPASISDLSVGSILPAIVTKSVEDHITVQLSESLAAPIFIYDQVDDLSLGSLKSYVKGQVLLVCVIGIDEESLKVRLSARPSRVSDEPCSVIDREIRGLKDLKVNEIVRGFVKSIEKIGIFVTVAPNISVLVKVTDISDSYIQDWASKFTVGQLLRGRIISVNRSSNRALLSLKESVLDDTYKPLMTYNDVQVGQIVRGKIRKVESYGVFVVFQDSANVSGLCHKTELSDEVVPRVEELYDAGDSVRAVIIDFDIRHRRISLSMKPSLLAEAESRVAEMSDAEPERGSAAPSNKHALSHETSDCESARGGVAEPRSRTRSNNMDVEFLLSPTQERQKNGAVRLPNSHQQYNNMAVDSPLSPAETRQDGELVTPMHSTAEKSSHGLSTGGFNWLLPTHEEVEDNHTSDSEAEAMPTKKAKRKRAGPIVDRTGDLDANGPISRADFERLLLSQSNQSMLWLQYMAFELQHGEVGRARTVAERAVRSINHHTAETEQEVLNAWMGYLNLENSYGDDELLTQVFDRACEVNDPQVVQSKLASVFIKSGKLDKAEAIFESMMRKHTRDRSVWSNYAAFLFDVRAEPDRARGLLPRALQSLPAFEHVNCTRDFARLEFRSKNGQPERGRTIFENLLNLFPKRMDLWNVLLDLELRVADDPAHIRRLFERILATKMKPRTAHRFYNRWLEYEKAYGTEKGQKMVEARAREYTRALMNN